MNILAIGNSFSQDASRYLHAIAKHDGEMINVANLYIGGCSLERHYQNMLSQEKAYELQYNGVRTGFYVSLNEALNNRQWDIITVQQVSHLSFDPESYLPYISALTELIRSTAPQAKLYLHQTWAYEDGSERLLNIAKYPTSKQMLADIVKANEKIASLISADGIIPSGELFGKLSDNGLTGLHRDTFHASLGLGRYALGLLWYRTFTKKNVLENSFSDFDEYISEDHIKVVKALINLTF